MPFITQERREGIASGMLKLHDFVPGDLCYIAYKTPAGGTKDNRGFLIPSRSLGFVLSTGFGVVSDIVTP